MCLLWRPGSRGGIPDPGSAAFTWGASDGRQPLPRVATVAGKGAGGARRSDDVLP